MASDKEKSPFLDTAPAEIFSENVRVQIVKGKPKGMWGFAFIGKLPVCFSAWKTEFSNNSSHSWWPHAPYNVLEFSPIISTGPANDQDYQTIGEKMGIDTDLLQAARADGKLKELLRGRLTAMNYNSKLKELQMNVGLRPDFGSKVSETCSTVEALLEEPEGVGQEGSGIENPVEKA